MIEKWNVKNAVFEEKKLGKCIRRMKKSSYLCIVLIKAIDCFTFKI